MSWTFCKDSIWSLYFVSALFIQYWVSVSSIYMFDFCVDKKRDLLLRCDNNDWTNCLNIWFTGVRIQSRGYDLDTLFSRLIFFGHAYDLDATVSTSITLPTELSGNVWRKSKVTVTCFSYLKNTRCQTTQQCLPVKGKRTWSSIKAISTASISVELTSFTTNVPTTKCAMEEESSTCTTTPFMWLKITVMQLHTKILKNCKSQVAQSILLLIYLFFSVTYQQLKEEVALNPTASNRQIYDKVSIKRKSDLGENFNTATVPLFHQARIVMWVTGQLSR